jgi:hypothetical protein
MWLLFIPGNESVTKFDFNYKKIIDLPGSDHPLSKWSNARVVSEINITEK